MRILFDHQAFTLQQYGGVSRYHAELFRNLRNDQLAEVNISLFTSANQNLQILYPFKFRNFFGHNPFPGKRTVLNIVNKLYSQNCLKKVDFDIFHPTYYDPYFIPFLKGRPFVLTVHDTIHERLSSLFKELKTDKPAVTDKGMIIRAAAKIITVSDRTKQDIIDIYGVKAEGISVIPLGHSLPLPHSNNMIPLRFGPTTKFLLFVGNRGLYKNFNFFLSSISKVFHEELDLFLVCAGGPAFDEEELTLINRLSLTKRVIYQGINDFTLNYIYSKAIAFVFPSLYEGFGIPVLEAMENGCPCLLSNRGSLPEVAEDNAVYFEPDDSESIYNAVFSLINDKELRKRLSLQGKKRVRNFSWKKNAIETEKVYRSIYN